MAPTTSGTEITLTSGDWAARIVSVGAGMAGLTLRGVDLIHPHSADEVPDGFLGKTLIPWPNRIANGTYTWRGVTREVAVNEPQTGSALHGLMCWVDWDIVHSDEDSVTLAALVAGQPGYPWALRSCVTYALHHGSGLSVTITSTNIGSETAPYGVSSHPYLTIGEADVDSYRLSVPAAAVAEVDEDLIPIRTVAVDSVDLDLRSGDLVGPKSIDHAFTDLPAGPWQVRLEKDGSWVEMSSDAPWVQVYSGERLGRRSIAVEPMTCAPNAFNSGDGLIELEPGQSHTLTFTINGHVE
ncbi:MAG: aldose-1-epimerase [Actinomycetaceae bacterium]|nr:aldose-1-epimerase [Actinomycetaceae bacterium]